MPNAKPTRKVTDFQERVYSLLLQIPPSRVTSYATLAGVLQTSPRAVGNALRHNPFSPAVPCHRVINASGYLGGYLGECAAAAPSGVNQTMKRELLAEEGVAFDEAGWLIVPKEREGKDVDDDDDDDGVWFHGPWDLSGKLKGPVVRETSGKVLVER